MKTPLRFALAGIVAGLIGAIAYAQNAGQTLSTLVGTELFPVQSAINSTAAITYSSVNEVRNSDGWVYVVAANAGTLTMTTKQASVALNPAAEIAGYTITVPPLPQDGAVVSIFSSQIIDTLTIQSSDSSTFVPTLATTIGANGKIGIVYDRTNNVWHEIF
jgi:hypothetical protein